MRSGASVMAASHLSETGVIGLTTGSAKAPKDTISGPRTMIYADPSTLVASDRLGSPLRGMFAERPFREPHLYAVGRMRAQNIHDAFIGFRPRPILLEFEQVLAGCDRDCACLHRAIHRAVMRLHRQIATGVGRNIDFVAFV